jgi:ubiquinone/menaquinone biosynthesis C-methylase UbiE
MEVWAHRGEDLFYAWASQLEPGQWVLDAGSGPGSFPASHFHCSVVALDEDTDAFQTAVSPTPPQHHRAFGRSDQMPFGGATFDLVICHHSLEHIVEIDKTLSEIERVLKPKGRFYVAVPNGHGLCDAIYRFMFEGGGHVNRFHRSEVVRLIESRVGIRLVRWSKLYSSFAYLWRLAELLDAPPPDLSKRLLAFRRLPRRTLRLFQRLLYTGTRLADRAFGTDLAVYGWALYFERSEEPVEQDPAYLNVCRNCGAGAAAASLKRSSRFKYRCRICNTVNPYFTPFRNTI